MTEIRTYLEALLLVEDEPRLFEPGQIIFQAGDPGRHMFVVRAGTVELRSVDTVLETVGKGGVFGEMALVDPAPRSATAVAGEGCSLAAIDATAFHGLVQKVPGLALEVMKVMARRLRQMTAQAP
ncbi:MAG TPA: Crp/Fnr family transcriptional regulator [Vicinamibacteria bacterium]|jgi:CRP/FNR family cyclic AMP-dependent transcriptional regulator|nr:Crp/Fnr family transcriptional regulator [Vicinamibacteria bacterium]